MDALRLDPPPDDLWERFHREPALVPADPVVDALISRWTRARALGAAPEGLPPDDALVRGDALADRCSALAPILHDGNHVVSTAVAAASARDYTLLVADRDGVVTFADGGGAFGDDARRLRLIAGASWSESTRGTNAIGTAIAEDRTIAVRGGAHYGRRYRDLVCYAAPIHDCAGRVIGVVDATSHVGCADPSLGLVVSAAALALEAVGRARMLASAGVAAHRVVERTLDRVGTPGMVLERSGRIVRCNAAARVWLGAAPRSAEGALGVAWAALEREALHNSPGGLVIRGRSGDLRARVEPLFDGEGALFAVALFADEPTTRRSVSRPAADPRPDAFSDVFAEDPATLAAVAFARRVAPSDLPVVLLSETGSGKELFAAAVHRASRRADGPFVAVNCGSVAPTLLESELFGYAPGAFTGADRQGRDGWFHAASGGTLFLDEVAEMPAPMQTALLRVLESGRYTRVGDTAARTADVRIVCATCRDLPGLVASGGFRQDLYYRLKGVQIVLPPLRDRADRLALARHLLARDGDPAPTIGPDLAAWIESYGWPGNVRELKSVLAVARVLAGDAPELVLEHLPPDLAHQPAPARSPAERLAEVERWAVERALAELGGNVSAAARRLGVARSTIYRMLQRG